MIVNDNRVDKVTVPKKNNASHKLNFSEPIKLKGRTGKNKSKLDSTDIALLQVLLHNASMPAAEISKKLSKQGIDITERGTRKRIIALEKYGIIKSHTILIDDSFAGRNVNRIILVKFKNTKDFVHRLEKYKKYLNASPYCTFAIRIRGDLDWLHYKSFPTKHIADREDDVFRELFGDVMQEYRSYDAEVIKQNFFNLLDEDSVSSYLNKINPNDYV
ncbi:MAG: hypothetical protein HZA82_02825 [Thaumarchaeota archaeon]|nr:hypothetical protein [Nitrososphaerota archaeon]